MPITINKKTDHFFISICKIHAHSFLMLGVYDKNRVSHLLCRIGKWGYSKKDPKKSEYSFTVGYLFNLLFFSVRAKLTDEGVFRERESPNPINYQAYDITYEQYLEFIQKLEGLQETDNIFRCYQPIEENGDEVTLIFARLCSSHTNLDKLKSTSDNLCIGNTCRHTAIAVIEEVEHAPISAVSSLVSKTYFIDLPYKTQLAYGMPTFDIPFYVLPAPPAAFPGLSEMERRVAKKLYKRMEHMLLLDPDSLQTQNKFASLKNLYTKIVRPQKKVTLEELLLSVQSWKEENQSTLSVLRKTYLWDRFFTRKSATMKMITEIEADIKQAQN